jgi:hypothetical protein
MRQQPARPDDDAEAAWLAPVPVDPEAAVEEQRLADLLRRVLHRLVLVRPSPAALRKVAAATAAFADELDTLPARGGSGDIGEAGLRPQDHVRHSPLSGTSNPLAPPMQMWTTGTSPTGHPITAGSVRFGAAYEGPPEHVHGGYVAALFDELLGRTQGSAGFTAWLTVNYHRPTPLDRTLTLHAEVERVEGRKRWIRGTCYLGDTLLSTAEGLFIAPREGASLEALRESLKRNSTPL